MTAHIIEGQARVRRLATRTGLASLTAAVALASGCGGGAPDRPTPTTPTGPAPTATATTPPVAGAVSDIFTVTPGGSDPRQISHATDGTGFDTAAWSPDGKALAASGPACDDCPDRITIFPADGSTPVPLTNTAEGVDRPSYSPSGDRLAYVGGGNNAVYVANRDGSDEHAVIDDGVAHSQVVWSPNGRALAFTTQQADGSFAIELATPDGSARQVIARQADHPAWSPDGRRIAFTDTRAGAFAIAVMSANGGERRRLTDPTQNAQQPSWSPDGRSIVFTRVSATGAQLAIMTATGSGVRSLRLPQTRVSSPRWSPDGTRIAFTVNY